MKIFIHLKMLILPDTTQTLLIDKWERWKMPAEWKINTASTVFDVIFTSQAVLTWWFTHLSPLCNKHLKSRWKADLSKQTADFRSLWYSQDPTVSQTELLTKHSAPTLLSDAVGAERRCQIIWQAKWDIFIRSSTPSQTGAKVSWGNLSPL